MTEPINDDPITAALGASLWFQAIDGLIADSALTVETFVVRVMKLLAAVKAEQPDAEADLEGFERHLRQKLEIWWPRIQARVAALREMGLERPPDLTKWKRS